MALRREKYGRNRSMQGEEGSYLAEPAPTPTEDGARDDQAERLSAHSRLGKCAVPPVVEWGPDQGQARREQLGEHEPKA